MTQADRGRARDRMTMDYPIELDREPGESTLDDEEDSGENESEEQ